MSRIYIGGRRSELRKVPALISSLLGVEPVTEKFGGLKKERFRFYNLWIDIITNSESSGGFLYVYVFGSEAKDFGEYLFDMFRYKLKNVAITRT